VKIGEGVVPRYEAAGSPGAIMAARLLEAGPLSNAVNFSGTRAEAKAAQQSGTRYLQRAGYARARLSIRMVTGSTLEAGVASWFATVEGI